MSQYTGLAEVWAASAALAYGPLAVHLVDRLEGSLSGTLALDAGAGSGVAGDALRARGARVIAADREFDMAAYAADSDPAVTADVLALPSRNGSFDVVVAAFVVNHLADPGAGLAELRRVTRPGGVVLASTFSTSRAAAKGAVDDVATRHGFEPPAWYADLRVCADSVGDVSSFDRAVAEAGFTAWTVTEEAVDVGLVDPADVVRYRLAVPQLHAFVSGLDERRRTDLVADAVEAVRATGERFRPEVVEVVATV